MADVFTHLNHLKRGHARKRRKCADFKRQDHRILKRKLGIYIWKLQEGQKIFTLDFPGRSTQGHDIQSDFESPPSSGG